MTPQAAHAAPDTFATEEPLLEIRDLSVQFAVGPATIHAVSGVSLSVFREQCVGVVGESGSGKSVTFAAALGLVARPGRVTGGSVRFAGREVLSLGAAALRRLRGSEMALVMQDALSALNPALTIGQQILETLRAHATAQRAGIGHGTKRAIALLDMVRIPQPSRCLALYPHELSGGMRQRAMIAIALACNPKLLIADEPTTALDVTLQAQILSLLAELRRELGMTMVLITHNLAVVSEQCDHVYVMYAGKVMESGPVDNVIAAPRHPYTQGLLRSMPRLETRHQAIVPIPGQVPDLSQPPAGCVFYDRCPHAAPACRVEVQLEELVAGQPVRCVLQSRLP